MSPPRCSINQNQSCQMVLNPQTLTKPRSVQNADLLSYKDTERGTYCYNIIAQNSPKASVVGHVYTVLPCLLDQSRIVRLIFTAVSFQFRRASIVSCLSNYRRIYRASINSWTGDEPTFGRTMIQVERIDHPHLDNDILHDNLCIRHKPEAHECKHLQR